MNPRRATLPLLLLALTACGPAEPPPVAPVAPTPPPEPPHVAVIGADEATPKVRLPTDTRPTAETLVLTVDPKKDGFSGAVDISVTLDKPRGVIWLHGKNMHVTRATATPEGGTAVNGAWKQRDESGIAALTLDANLPAGKATLHLEFDAPFGPKLEGLYKVTQAGTPYAFTQFESIAARDAFPCFDEPGFKIPFDTTLVVPADQQAVANTHEVERKVEGASLRVHFAPTLPIPSYLVAFAVGPLDIVTVPDIPPNSVRKRPLPLRGVTAHGRGKEIAYALAHTGEILATLEQYFGIEYAYDKLDILAVPDKGGAMENPGAVTYAEYLVLMDENTAPLRQKRAYAGVMAHELAHQWVGDLVTAAWWDDIWLNEAFATWVGSKTVDKWNPKLDAAMDLLRGVQGAISEDVLVSTRAVRQPIESTNDIENAFDSITYQKGGGVISMFERWMGPETLRRGVHEYLDLHRFGSATADDFLGAVSKVAGKDVKTPFHTFLDQPGVPFVEAELKCDGTPRLHLHQSRYLPLGSTGDTDKTWQIPVCARYQEGRETKEACTLLTAKDGDLPLGAKCPTWVFPNADASGYFRFGLAAPDLARLQSKGFGQLSGRERVALGNSLRAAYGRGTLSMKNAMEAAAPLAADSHREVAGEPMGFISTARDWFHGDPLEAAVESYGRKLFAKPFKKLGWKPARNEEGDATQLRSSVLNFMALTARDPGVRADAKKRAVAFLGYGTDNALHPDAVDANLAGIALSVMGEDADPKLWEAVYARLVKTDDAELRGRLLSALTAGRTAALVPRIRELVFDPALQATEVTSPLWSLLSEPATREETWRWIKLNFPKLLATVPKHHGQTQLIRMGSVFCDEAHVKDVESFFDAARVGQIDGGPRVLASTLESVRLCAVKRAKQEGSAREFFGKHP